MTLNIRALELDCERECSRIDDFVRNSVVNVFKKKGAVVAVSGGIDSSTTAALCVRALGREHVFALLMPERDSSSESLHYGRRLVQHLGVAFEVVDIAPTLEVMGCYRFRDEAIREIFPEYSQGYKNKLTLTSTGEAGSRFGFFSVVIAGPDGVQKKRRLPVKNYLQILAATNMKQRTRKSLEYFHADRLNYAVAGTPNLLEHDQGFFVRLGDGAADLKPIAHLYKTQVFQMARHLGLPEDLVNRRSTTDTYSLEQTQEEFYFNVPLEKLDLVLFGVNQGHAADAIALETGMPPEEVEWIIKDIRQKRSSTAPLHLQPLTLMPSKAVSSEGCR
ncbi:MAG: NAD(+) synthase [Acidobacteria bacterium]|nr:NAD(+) synthase [Acidobacteriota bacterium]MCI0621731.1 NAD(+) synthase [Acidobacteriota bacterium]MCI0718381.1 NAD(+) synthase [Acidobacteriota bacterium]